MGAEGGDPGRTIDDDVIAARGEFWCFLMQGFPGQTDSTEQSWQAILVAALCPVECRALGIGIEQDHRTALHRQFAGEVRGERRLADPAFLVEQGDDHDAPPSASRLIHSAQGLFIVSFMDSKLEPKLEDAETRAAQGFPTRSHS